MSNGIVPKETFRAYTAKSQRETMYDAITELHREMKKAKKYDKITTFGGGVIGGILFWLALKFKAILPF